MQSFLQNLSHLIMATLVIASAATLAALGVISGAEAITVIVGVGGFSLGVGGSSTSLSTVASAIPAVLSLTGASTPPTATATDASSTPAPVTANGNVTAAVTPVPPMSAGA